MNYYAVWKSHQGSLVKCLAVPQALGVMLGSVSLPQRPVTLTFDYSIAVTLSLPANSLCHEICCHQWDCLQQPIPHRLLAKHVKLCEREVRRGQQRLLYKSSVWICDHTALKPFWLLVGFWLCFEQAAFRGISVTDAWVIIVVFKCFFLTKK